MSDITPISLETLYTDAVVRAQPPRQSTVKTRWTAAEILAFDFPEPRWLVNGLVPFGLIMLGGRPKVGKSWLALQIAIAIGSGGVMFGEFVHKGKVLYLALEDSPRRIQNRLNKQKAERPNITFCNSYTPFTEGGLVELQAEISAGGYNLCVIDTFARAISGRRRVDHDDTGDMTSIVGNIQQIATNLDVAILVIDHHRKSNGFEASPIDDILGSTAKSAVADCAMGIYREQGKKGAVLKITGRDVEEQELALEWDPELFCWQSLGDANDVRKDSFQANIIMAIRTLKEDGDIPTTTRIAKFLRKDKGYTSATLTDLVNIGKLRRGEKVGREVPFEEVTGSEVTQQHNNPTIND